MAAGFAALIGIYPVTAIGEVTAGTDLAAVITAALEHCQLLPVLSFDVIVVTQKIVSKAEDRFVDLAAIAPGDEAVALAATTRKDARLVELVLRESVEVVRAAPHVLITRNVHGQVMANAGIDRSNLGPASSDTVLLLPVDPDRSAEQLHHALKRYLGTAPGVVISDSFGRPWRYGVVNVALGAAGLPAVVDRRGDHDRDGRVMEVTQIALGDALATAAGLVMGEGEEGIPVALVRGLSWRAAPSPAATLVRPLNEDLFR